MVRFMKMIALTLLTLTVVVEVANAAGLRARRAARLEARASRLSGSCGTSGKDSGLVIPLPESSVQMSSSYSARSTGFPMMAVPMAGCFGSMPQMTAPMMVPMAMPVGCQGFSLPPATIPMNVTPSVVPMKPVPETPKPDGIHSAPPPGVSAPPIVRWQSMAIPESNAPRQVLYSVGLPPVSLPVMNHPVSNVVHAPPMQMTQPVQMYSMPVQMMQPMVSRPMRMMSSCANGRCR